MLSAKPITYLKGYRLALKHAIPAKLRKPTYVMYWRMSTGGAFL